MTQAIEKKDVFSPVLDFFLLGGASLIIFPLVMLAFPVQMLANLNLFPIFISIILCLDYFSNFPHFAYSYQLMYQNFPKKISGEIDRPLRYRYILAGILVPAAMIAFFILGYLQNSTALLRNAVNVMFLTAGWHYAKQGFGILIVVSAYQKVFYALWERRILLANAHLLWIYAWIMFNTGSKEKNYLNIIFHTLGLPKVVESIFAALVGLSMVALTVALYRKWRKESVFPPLNGITAYVASAYLWVILRFGMGFDNFIHPVVMLIPFMHAVQYITIVLRMKENEVARHHISRAAFVGFVLMGILIGALIFNLVPRFFDRTLPYDRSIFGPTLFLFMFYIFINIHHYFIDNVIWRREGTEAKKFLFSAH